MSLTIGLKANITYSLFLLKHGALRHIVWTYMQEVDWYKMDKMFGVKHSEILKWFESKIQYKMSSQGRVNLPEIRNIIKSRVLGKGKAGQDETRRDKARSYTGILSRQQQCA